MRGVRGWIHADANHAGVVSDAVIVPCAVDRAVRRGGQLNGAGHQ